MVAKETLSKIHSGSYKKANAKSLLVPTQSKADEAFHVDLGHENDLSATLLLLCGWIPIHLLFAEVEASGRAKYFIFYITIAGAQGRRERGDGRNKKNGIKWATSKVLCDSI